MFLNIKYIIKIKEVYRVVRKYEYKGIGIQNNRYRIIVFLSDGIIRFRIENKCVVFKEVQDKIESFSRGLEI